MIENKKVMARNIQLYMKKNNVNATDICNHLGIKQNTFSDWVNAKTYPRIDAIEKLARYFHVNKAFLVEEITPIDAVTSDEMDLIISFRNADASTQESIRRLLAYEQIKKEG